MGYAIAAAAAALGAETTLISGPTGMTPPPGVELIAIESTAELHEQVRRVFGGCDCLVMAAAPSDYRPASVADRKLKRSGPLSIDLEPTVDILKSLAPDKRDGQVVVGFALETDNGVENARRKLREKHLDLIVLNLPGPDSGFSTDTNRVTVIRPGRKPDRWPVLPKDEVAARLMQLVAKLLA